MLPADAQIPSDLNAKGKPISAKDYYVLWNIFVCVAQFWRRMMPNLQERQRIYQYDSTVWSAIATAAPVAQGYVGSLVSTFNPPATTNVVLDDFLQALSVAFAFICLPAAAQLSNGALNAANGLIAALQQAPGAAKYMFPQLGTLGSQVAEWSSLAGSLSDMIKNYLL